MLLDDRVRAELLVIEIVRRAGGLDVAAQKPNELSRGILGGLEDVPVVGKGLRVLGKLELCLELVVDVLETGGKIRGGRNGDVVGNARFERWMVTGKRVER